MAERMQTNGVRGRPTARLLAGLVLMEAASLVGALAVATFGELATFDRDRDAARLACWTIAAVLFVVSVGVRLAAKRLASTT